MKALKLLLLINTLLISNINAMSKPYKTPSSVLLSDGGWTSGGGNRKTDEMNPWFMGDAPIEYCVEVADDFPIHPTRVREIIAESFEQWKNVIESYNLHLGHILEFRDGIKRGLSTKYKEVSECNNPKHQLHFKIGVVDDVVKDLLKSHTETAIGYAFRKAYDHNTFRTGGYIWTAPKGWVKNYKHVLGNLKELPLYNHDNQFESLILHELSHIFGVPNLRGTRTGPLSENIITQVGEDQLVIERNRTSYISTRIETYERKLSLKKSIIHNFKLIDESSNSHAYYNKDKRKKYAQSLGSLLLKKLGHNIKSDPWKETQYSSMIYGAKVTINTQKGKSYTLSGENISFITPNYFNSAKSIQFYSPKIKSIFSDPNRDTLLEMDHFWNIKSFLFNINGQQILLRFDFTGGELDVKAAKIERWFGDDQDRLNKL